jgi:hypothetical protein
MAFFVVLGLILLMGLAGRRPSRGSYFLIVTGAVGVSLYEYFFK